jgi:hypothetical protein
MPEQQWELAQLNIGTTVAPLEDAAAKTMTQNDDWLCPT